MDPPNEVGVTIGLTLAEITRAILLGIASLTIWLLKKLGDKHLTAMDGISDKQTLILDKLTGLDTRVTLLEYKMTTHLTAVGMITEHHPTPHHSDKD